MLWLERYLPDLLLFKHALRAQRGITPMPLRLLDEYAATRVSERPRGVLIALGSQVPSNPQTRDWETTVLLQQSVKRVCHNSRSQQCVVWCKESHWEGHVRSRSPNPKLQDPSPQAEACTDRRCFGATAGMTPSYFRAFIALYSGERPADVEEWLQKGGGWWECLHRHRLCGVMLLLAALRLPSLREACVAPFLPVAASAASPSTPPALAAVVASPASAASVPMAASAASASTALAPTAVTAALVPAPPPAAPAGVGRGSPSCRSPRVPSAPWPTHGVP